MTRRIMRLGVHRTALVSAICMAVFALIIALIITPFMMMVPRTAETSPGMMLFGSWAMVIVLPIVYFIIGYIGTAIWTALFNLVTPRIGGIPITFAEDESPAAL